MNAVVVLPSYNPDEKMVETVKGLRSEGFDDIVVVDDGSLAEKKKFFEEAAVFDGVEVLTHEENKGKGRAMKTAFEYIERNRSGISGVVTVDGDGQHLPKDIKRCIALMEQEKDKVVLGVRDFYAKDIPFRSRFGNNLTKWVFRVACGIKISDTQTGLRAIPAKYLPLMADIEGERYEYETNQLLYMKRQGIEMREAVIETVYLENNESSHFHPIKDSIKIYKVIFKFIATSLASFAIDILLFTIINLMLSITDIAIAQRLFIATAGARAISSLANYTLNKKVVFDSGESVASSLPRYYMLCILQTLMSYGLVWLFAEFIFHLKGSLLETFIKMAVDMCLFCASFKVQQGWVFKTGQVKKD